ncbi:MAG: DUF1203 domain-containing protein [Pseudomonadota bacterium]
MSFQINALPEGAFAPLFSLSDEELKAVGGVRQTVDQCPGTPCRVSLEDAAVGETVILIHYEHQPANAPYRASHAIFVRNGVTQAVVPEGAVPELFLHRLISVRAFDGDDMMVGAEVVQGTELKAAIERHFANREAAYLHLHYAAPGCFAASVTRVAS